MNGRSAEGVLHFYLHLSNNQRREREGDRLLLVVWFFFVILFGYPPSSSSSSSSCCWLLWCFICGIKERTDGQTHEQSSSRCLMDEVAGRDWPGPHVLLLLLLLLQPIVARVSWPAHEASSSLLHHHFSRATLSFFLTRGALVSTFLESKERREEVIAFPHP